jgi:lipopolysaccharide/colanic/teichoic acid biosynthesis glycosyltransferase
MQAIGQRLAGAARRVSSTKMGIISKTKIAVPYVPYTPTQRKFYAELEAVVRDNYGYLRELEETTGAELPGHYRIAKRGMDIFVGVLGLFLLSPLLFVVSIVIKLTSRGPVFINQERVGKGGKSFRMHKFRTMIANAEKETGPVWAIKNDPRITFIGRILRKSKIDELPQLVNLVKGEMTMVGPRPERPAFVNLFTSAIPGYTRRLDVLPGITGLAQLRNGYDRSAMHVISKLRTDISYIREMDLSMDLRLLGETFIAVLTGKL